MNQPPPAHGRVWPVWVIAGPGLASLIGALLLTLSLVPRWIERTRLEFHLSSAQTVIAAAGFLVAALVTSPAGVLLGGRFPSAAGISGIVLMIIGLSMDALAPSGGLFLAGRVVSGLGAGAVIATAVAVALRTGPLRRPAAGSVIGMIVLFLVIGFLIGGYSGRPLFLFVLPPLLIALVAGIVTAVILLVLRGRPGVPRT